MASYRMENELMGMAASQARYIMLTGRKSDVEYQGQQINQSRMCLAQESSNLFNKLMNLKAPSTTDFAASASDATQNWADKTVCPDLSYDAPDTNNTAADDKVAVNSRLWHDNGNAAYVAYTGTVLVDANGAVTANPGSVLTGTGTAIDPYVVTVAASGSVTMNGTTFTPVANNEVNDNYEIAMWAYNKAVTDVNLKIEDIHAQDRALELQLRNLDTQQKAISTELDSVKKVIDKNIESTFKTFAS